MTQTNLRIPFHAGMLPNTYGNLACERIRWPRPVIENAKDPILKIWGNKRKGEKRICLWLENCNYLVVLAERKGFYLIWTAYPVISEHQKRKLNAEYEKAHKC